MTDRQRRLEYVALDDITGAPRNPKRHRLEGIRGSISRFGFASPCLRDERTGKLVIGHGRADALRQMEADGESPPAGVSVADDGRWLVPVVCGWASRSDSEAESLLVADNRHNETGGWDHQELAELLTDMQSHDQELVDVSGWDMADLEDILNASEPPDLDDLATEVGEPSEDAGWPVVKLKVPHHLSSAWESHLDTFRGDVPAAFAKLLDLDPTPPPVPDWTP